MTANRQQQVSVLDSQLIARHESMIYTYRTHEKAADRFARNEKWRKQSSLVLVVLATGSFLVSLTDLFGLSEDVGGLLTSAVAMFAAGVAFAADYLRYEERMVSHSNMANELRQIAIGFETLRVDLNLGRKTIDQVSDERDVLLAREKELLSLAPRTTRADYEKADKSLNGDEKLYSPDAEIETRDLLAKDRD